MNLVRQLRFESPPHLPPLSAAPILQHYDIETKRLSADYQLAAPVDERGIVDIYATVDTALNLVDPEYVWPRDSPQPDIHHFVWERAKYHPRYWNESHVPRDYREIPFHKGYMPRQFHDFLHTVMTPPPIPSLEVMQRRVASYEVARDLFLAARQAIMFNRHPEHLSGVRLSPTGELELEEDILQTICQNMQDNFTRLHAHVQQDNEFISPKDAIDAPLETIARTLGKIAAHDGINLFPKIYGNRRAA